MSYDNPMAVDTRGIATTGLTSSTTLANHFAGIAGAVLAVDGAGNNQRVAEAMHMLQQLVDCCKRLKL